MKIKNIGSCIRTGNAFGIDGSVLEPGHSDPAAVLNEFLKALNQAVLDGNGDILAMLARIPPRNTIFVGREIKEQSGATLPLKVSDIKGGHGLYYFYQDHIFKFDRPGYSATEVMVLLKSNMDRDRRHLERLKDLGDREGRNARKGIPERVRNEVWRRANGRCARCESVENLEFDHMIPLSKGGSNTARNLELLCEKCNREKRDHIG